MPTRLILILTLSALAVLILAPAADAQPAASQYVAGSPATSPTLSEAGVSASGASAGEGTSGGGEMPLSGYPLTPVVTIAVLALLTGLLARLALLARDQRRA